MADINVEPRKRMGLWPWIVGLLVIALAIWAFTELLGDDEGEAAVESLEREAATAPAAAPAPPPP